MEQKSCRNCKYFEKLYIKEGICFKEFTSDVSKSTLSEWLNDKNEPPMSVIVEIAKFLEVSTDYLLGIEK